MTWLTRYQVIFFSLLFLSGGWIPASWASLATPAGFFSGRYKAQCDQGAAGCPCRKIADPGSEIVSRIRHAMPVEAVDTSAPAAGLTGWVELKSATQGKCFYPAKDLLPLSWDNRVCPSPDAESSVPFPKLEEILAEGTGTEEQKPMGILFPTFYNIADEGFHEGELVETLLESGTLKSLAQVTPGFRKELDIQGTGRLRDGRILNVADRINGSWRYRVLTPGDYGQGIQGHRIHPLRSVALDFSHLCKSGGFPFCDEPIDSVRRKLVGTLLFIPRMAGARLANGAIHDGFVCAQDIGGAIREDRVDLFVGPAGAGNPYVPDCRQRNAYTDHGIQSVNPTDWPTVEKTGIDAEGRATYKRVNPYEYRSASPGKGLKAWIVQGAKCRP